MANESRTPDTVEDLQLNTIMVPVDFSENSVSAVDYAIKFARKFNSRVLLVHVYHFPVELLTDWSAYGTLAGSGEILEAMRKERSEQMAALAQEKSRSGARIETKVLEGTPFSEIVQAARNEHVDLLIMGTRGLTGIKHILIGSTAEKVVRKAPCPVLVLKPESFDFQMP
jgi:nucleotide-binding universal stress UspA family protein